MTPRHSRTTIAAFGLAACMSLFIADMAQAGPGYWDCRKGGWSAYTTIRGMEGMTAFECGGICGDDSHSQPTSWVDITGGISQSQEDISDSFFGPLSGEWNGCAPYGSSQSSTGVKWIEGINQSWDRWPSSWSTARYMMQDISFFTRTASMNNPYASVYDLDCAPGWISWTWGGSCPKDVIGTVYWDNFAVSSRLVAGSPVPNLSTGFGYAKWELAGDTGVYCSTPANGCESTVCSDLHVRSTFECRWVNTADDCPYAYIDCL